MVKRQEQVKAGIAFGRWQDNFLIQDMRPPAPLSLMFVLVPFQLFFDGLFIIINSEAAMVNIR